MEPGAPSNAPWERRGVSDSRAPRWLRWAAGPGPSRSGNRWSAATHDPRGSRADCSSWSTAGVPRTPFAQRRCTATGPSRGRRDSSSKGDLVGRTVESEGHGSDVFALFPIQIVGQDCERSLSHVRSFQKDILGEVNHRVRAGVEGWNVTAASRHVFGPSCDHLDSRARAAHGRRGTSTRVVLDPHAAASEARRGLIPSRNARAP